MAQETFIDVVRERAGRLGERCAFTFLGDGESPSERLSYADVDRKARSIAADLQSRGAAGERVLLLFPPGLDFVTAFLGCLYAGAVAVPAYPPSPGRGTGRLRNLLEDAKPRLALTTPALLGRVGQEVADAVALEGLPPEDWRPPAVSPDSLAFLQYTSGSTSTPKGVRVTHGNLIANERAIQLSFGQSEDSVVVGWLPLYHDMGLIGNVLQPLWCGATCVLMSPLSFLQRPRRWLEAIDRFRGTTSGGPNFAYELCVRKVQPEGLDLSSWKVAFNGAEPVRAATLDAFAEAFAPQGFRREAFYPCYGLAEATLFVSGGDPGRAPRVVDNLVSCGGAWPGERIAVTDAEGRELPAGEEGEICVSGPSVADGYWNGERFGGFLRTGDLGWLDRHGELFVTGRLKDLIVIRGRNFYPHDIERTAEESHPALRPGGGAAFSVDDGGERLVIVHEVERRREAEAGEATEAIRAAVLREHEVSPHDVVPIRAGTLPKTSSGKVRRGACREAYVAGTLTRLGLKPQARRVQPLPGLDLVCDLAARLLHVDPESLDPEAPLPLDSLLALELKNRLEEAGVSVSLTALLEGISPRRLAEQVGEAQPFELPAVEGTDHPLSYNQRSLWLAWRMAPESPVYNLALAARVSGDFNVEALNRHAVLRTTYPLVNGEPVQRIGGCEIDFAEGENLEEEAWRPFDLETGPVMRVRLFPDGVLLLAVHHIAADFWSLGLILEELAGKDIKDPKDLKDTKDGEPVSFESFRSLRSLGSFSYAAWSRWQRDLLASPEGERLWAGWREALAGAPTVLDLPADRPRPPLPTHRGGSHPFSLGPELSEKLRSLAAASGATLYTVLFAAFEALLHRHTGREDLLVGAPAAGRTRPGLEEVAGHFVNLLPIRADLSGDPTFSELVARTRRSLAGALERQDLPFPVLVERLDPARDPSRPPLVQVVFALEQPHRLEGGAAAAPFVLGQTGAPLRIGRLTLQPVELRRRATPFDLTLSAVETGGTIDAVFDYSSDLFDESTIERLARRFLTLLRNPGGRLSELPVLDEAERAQILAWEEGPVHPVPDRCVHELFEEWADRTPDAPALVGADGSVATYRELEARSNRLARHLLAAGAGPETPVALLLERSPELWTSALAVLKAGGWYVPIDPSYPRERIELLLADCNAGIAVTKELLREAFEIRSPERPRAAVMPDNLAYGLYTSGSTGRPKAVLVPHRPLLNVVRHAARDYRVGPGSRVLQWSAPAFDTSALEVFAALTSGAALCLASEEARISGPRLAVEMREQGITWAALTPAAFRFLPEEELPSTETISVGGEALPAAVAARWASRVRLFNAYGPTEAAVYTSVHFCRPGEEGAPPIGRPISNARLRVLGPWSREPLPTGVPGELCIGGTPPARGYLGRPDLTAERWIPEDGGARLYRTGDLVRWRPDGELEFLGRIDTQVKLRGVRIEPAEIEAALGTHPRVRAAVVVPRRSAAGEPVLVAYVVLQETMEDLSGELRAFLAERLPAAMVPAAFVSLSELPLTAVGKVDLKALPLPASLSDNSGAATALPRTEMERTIAAVWREVLGVESVGIDRNFFELGGHSLLMARVQTRLSEVLGRPIPLAEMFSHTTIGSLAARLAGEEGQREAAKDIQDRAASRRAAMDRRRARARH